MWSTSHTGILNNKSKYNLQNMKDYILSKVSFSADTAIILGSGMGAFADGLKNLTNIAYRDIPGYPLSTVKGHSGELTIGSIRNKSFIVAKGRFHYYEGYDMERITLPVRLFNLLGVKKLIITNAAGSLNLILPPGKMMVLDSHMDCTFRNFVSIPKKYHSKKFHDPSYIKIAFDSAKKVGLDIAKGTYCWTMGPAYETPDEVSFFQSIGGNAVGMSTVPEIKQAAKLNMRILAISTITNYATGIINKPLSHEEVIHVSSQVKDDFANLLTEIVTRI